MTLADGSVSRETEPLPATPDSARLLFGDALAAVEAYAGLLASVGVERGLIGPREVPRLWDRHLLNCGVISELIGPDLAVDDVGSGAGLPGIVLALQRPDLRVTLVEPLLRRSIFLVEAVAALGLTNVDVYRGRAEERSRFGATADVVTARAVAALPKLVGWCMPLVRPGGQLLAIKGGSAAAEVAERANWSGLGVSAVDVLTVGGAFVDPPTTVVRMRRSDKRKTTKEVRR